MVKTVALRINVQRISLQSMTQDFGAVPVKNLEATHRAGKQALRCKRKSPLDAGAV
jgi:hypothetical protein